VLEEQKERSTTAKPFKLGKLDPEKYHAKKEALSPMIQVMTRSITNNISKEDAAKVLFRRQGRGGTGSRWLPDYLIEVDKKKCADIADTAGPSRLRVAMTNERSPPGQSMNGSPTSAPLHRWRPPLPQLSPLAKTAGNSERNRRPPLLAICASACF